MIGLAWHGVERPALRGQPAVLDRSGVLAAWGEHDDPYATILAGVRRSPTPTIERRPCNWVETFEREVLRIARAFADPVIALGGGCDAAAILVAWQANGLRKPRVCTVATGLADYDEVDLARAIARQLHVPLEVVEIAPALFVELAPTAAVIAGTPLYNLHPVHRLALDRALGGAALITGDGADAIFAGVPDLDYVPIVFALTTKHASPYFADELVAGTPRDPGKTILREYLRARGFGWLADRPKRARQMPALELEPILDRARIAALARRLDLPPALETDRQRVGWATLEHLVRSLETA